jgi:hypothetical protein
MLEILASAGDEVSLITPSKPFERRHAGAATRH